MILASQPARYTFGSLEAPDTNTFPGRLLEVFVHQGPLVLFFFLPLPKKLHHLNQMSRKDHDSFVTVKDGCVHEQLRSMTGKN